MAFSYFQIMHPPFAILDEEGQTQYMQIMLTY